MTASRFVNSVLAALFLYTWPAVVAIHADDPDAAASLASAMQEVSVVASDFKFEPRAITISAGTAGFTIRNQGVIDHDLVILDDQRQLLAGSQVIAPGGTATFETTLSPGAYVVVCTLPGHREVGMTGELTVNP